MNTRGDRVDFDLDEAERKMLVLALNEFDGPAKQSFEVLPPMVGASSYGECAGYVSRLMGAIENTESQSELDWIRALFLAEVSFGSSLVASGRRFGPSADEYWILVLRSLQAKISTEHRYELLRDNTAFPSVDLAEERNASITVSDEPVALEFDAKQRRLVGMILNQFAESPRRAYPVLAPLLGQASYRDWAEYCKRLKEAVNQQDALTDLGWARALFLTDIGFTSDVVGFASKFRGDEKEGIVILRSIQDVTSTRDRYLLLSENATYAWYPRA
jgi:hypothetical protein